MIVWTTDEPSSSDVHFGATEALGDTVVSPPGAFTRDHQVVLTGLAADTLYFFAVASTDPDGNGPTTSATVSLRTSAVPDRLAPQITSGPTIVAATHDTLTVVWTTDEPASSGVSYNDGSTFFLVSDDQLSTRHQVTLAALRPATTYHITVSSTDLTGNGPTLGGPIDGTTLASPDTAAPVITEVRVSGDHRHGRAHHLEHRRASDDAGELRRRRRRPHGPGGKRSAGDQPRRAAFRAGAGDQLRFHGGVDRRIGERGGVEPALLCHDRRRRD